MSVLVLPSSHLHRPSRSRGVLGVLLALALIVGLAPTSAHSETTDDAISITVTGLDGVVAGTTAPADVTVRIADPGGLRGDTPLRLVGTLTADGGPAEEATVGLRRDDGSIDALEVDAGGRFVFPREDRAPLTLDGTPALRSSTGHTMRLQMTMPDAADYAFSVALVTSNERAASVVRRSGPERISTAADISANTFNPGVEVAYVTRADEFPDALAGGPVASLGGSPILLAYPTQLPAVTAAELARLQPGRIVALGGPNAISDAVLEQLRNLTEGEVTRLAGDDRFATAAAIALDRFSGPIDTVFVATGAQFADALSGGPAAALREAPVLLVAREVIPSPTVKALQALQPRRIVVLGGDVAVADAVVGRLGDFARDGVTRSFGTTRFETSAAISRQSFDPEAVHTVYLATGMKFPDSLAGAPAAVLDGAPLLLVTTDGIPEAVEAEIVRVQPGVIVILGGTAVVSERVADAAVLLTRQIAPDRERFTELAATRPASFTSGPVLGISAPSAEEPANARPRDRFTIAFATPHGGSFSLAYRPAGTTSWQGFPNLTASGSTAGGVTQAPVNAPLQEGSFDLRLTYTRTGGAPEVVIAEDALHVALTFPPPLISSLVEGVTNQSQLIAVRPVGGLDTGTVLEVGLGSAERAGANYPLDAAKLSLVNGTGAAELIVGRNQEAMIRYTAGPGDRVPGGAHPLLVFRIDGIDVAKVHQAHVGQFFRYDIMHGVQRIFAIGDGAGIASPTVTDVERGSPHTFQIVSFAVGMPIEPFETVSIDLSEAERAGVDYSDAFAFVLGGGGGHEEAEPAHDPEPGLGEAFLDVEPGESALLTFQAGGDGVPSVQPEGPTVQIFVGGLAAPDATVSPRVRFTRDDTGAATTTRFQVRPMGLREASASSLARNAVAAQQSFSVNLDGALRSGERLYVDLSRAQRSGLDYAGADISVLSGSGTATWDEDLDFWDPDSRRIAYTAGFGDGHGTVISLQLSGVFTPDVDMSERVRFYRSDSWAMTSVTFDVGTGSAIVGPFVSDLAAGEDEEYQLLAFSVREHLPEGQTVTIDLSAAETGAVSYGEADAFGYTEDEWWTPTDVALEVVDGTSAVVTYTAGEGGLATGAEVEIFLDGVAVADLEETYAAEFVRQGAAQTASATFSTRRMPGVTAVSASSLLSGANNQTQTLEATLVTDLPEGDIMVVDLSGAELGAARYGGAAVTVTQGSGTARIEAYTGYYAEVVYRAGPSDTDGAIISLELSGVNTDVGDETHAADFYRYDSWRTASALFDIGAGSPWVGQPWVSSLQAGSSWEWQAFTFRLARPLSAGEQVTMDLSSAEAGGVSYGDVEFIWVSRGDADLDVIQGVSAQLTYTAPGAGVPAGRYVWMELEGVSTDDVEEEHTVTFTDVTTGITADATFWVKSWDHDGEVEATATDYGLQSARGREPTLGPELRLGHRR